MRWWATSAFAHPTWLSLSSHTRLVTHAGIIRPVHCFWADEKMENLVTFKTHDAQLFVLAANATKTPGG
ncbi:hypothetical protein DO021_03425 [Desulfobacter hydrogenophilus]|uniref:Uncharacterized protein n=1 Tax=Desulfobacter hydrogenophilus TaxID=2291 RepID=A0A328FG41_9BACT|nr:hypothetical protein [Desulfobacter hydrogenophilus]NDY70701.1 hypothetical protein [Desulfobacter hydrogenophilus]QBH12685.1 hypothetical protein EYB58_07040 [Desulfobacter hydrogenophilus]RAM03349.1 hypothetical protein DO021_03425 [Desulfobacter hydrogenophilus]